VYLSHISITTYFLPFCYEAEVLANRELCHPPPPQPAIILPCTQNHRVQKPTTGLKNRFQIREMSIFSPPSWARIPCPLHDGSALRAEQSV
jgi:hypothetical protein